jgi:transposase-like protein
MITRPHNGEKLCERCGKTAEVEEVFSNNLVFYKCLKCRSDFEAKVDFRLQGSTDLEEKVICPWCEDITDGWGEGEEEHECESCGRKFDIEAETTITYSTCRSMCEMPIGYKVGDYVD